MSPVPSLPAPTTRVAFSIVLHFFFFKEVVSVICEDVSCHQNASGSATSNPPPSIAGTEDL